MRSPQSGVLFEQAVSVAPLTLPAHSSIFTGRFPPEHGVRDNGGFFLGPEQLTLAEVLKARGYRTGAFVGAYVLDSKWGLNQGFDTYVDDFDLSQTRGVSLGAIQRPGNEVVDKALPWIQQSAATPVLRLDSSLRRALPLPPARTVCLALPRAIRTTARSRLPTPRSAASSRSSSPQAFSIARSWS